MYDGDDYSLEGDMSVPSARRSNAQPGQPDFNTLDEPIKETIVSKHCTMTRLRKSNLISIKLDYSCVI